MADTDSAIGLPKDRVLEVTDEMILGMKGWTVNDGVVVNDIRKRSDDRLNKLKIYGTLFKLSLCPTIVL